MTYPGDSDYTISHGGWEAVKPPWQYLPPYDLDVSEFTHAMWEWDVQHPVNNRPLTQQAQLIQNISDEMDNHAYDVDISGMQAALYDLERFLEGRLND